MNRASKDRNRRGSLYGLSSSGSFPGNEYTLDDAHGGRGLRRGKVRGRRGRTTGYDRRFQVAYERGVAYDRRGDARAERPSTVADGRTGHRSPFSPASPPSSLQRDMSRVGLALDRARWAKSLTLGALAKASNPPITPIKVPAGVAPPVKAAQAAQVLPACMPEKKVGNEDNIRRAFKIIDADGSGTLDQVRVGCGRAGRVQGRARAGGGGASDGSSDWFRPCRRRGV
jgi:hypothetical protein